MSEQFKPYSPDEAWSEAELMKQKMGENEKLGYVDAESEIELEKVIESAKDGTLAVKIRALDLSDENNVDKLRVILRPWDGKVGQEKILDSEGSEIFQTKTRLSTFERKVGNILSSISKEYLQCIKESELKSKLELYGHGISKLGNWCLELSSTDHNVENGLKSLSGSDKFLNTLGVTAKFSATSMNGGLPSFFVDAWNGKMTDGEISDNFIINHPNYKSIMKMIELVDKFFETFYEVFVKYLSNQIQNKDFSFDGENQNISIEQVYIDYVKSNNIYRNASKLDMGNLENQAVVAELSKAVEEETQMFIEKIVQYQKVLDEFNNKLSYAKPQTEN